MAIPRSTVPEVTLQPLTVPFQQIQTSEAAFGGTLARAAGKLAQDLGQAGNLVDQIAMDMKAKDDERAVLNADNLFSQHVRQVEYGATDDQGNVTRRGFYDMKGEDAVQGAVGAKDDIDKRYKELLSGLGNQSQKIAFEKMARARLQRTYQLMDGYTIDQRRVAADDIDTARINEARDNLAAHPFDEGILGQSLLITADAVTRQAQRNGWQPEVTISKLQEAQTVVLKSAVEAALQQNPTGALALYNRVKGSIDGRMQPEIETLLKDAVVRQQAQQETDAIFSRADLTPKQRLEIARRIKDPLVRDDTVRRVNQRNAEEDAEKTRVQQEVRDQIFTHIWEDKMTVDKVFRAYPALAREAVKDDTLMKAAYAAEDQMKLGGIFRNTTDGHTYQDVIFGKTPISEVNPLRYRSDLTEAEYNRLTEVVRVAKSARDPSNKDHKFYSTATEYLRQFSPISLKWGAADQTEAQRRQQQGIQMSMMVWVADNLARGHEPTDLETAAKARQLSLSVNVPKGLGAYILDFIPFVNPTETQTSVADAPFVITQEMNNQARIPLGQLPVSAEAVLRAEAHDWNAAVSDALIEKLAFARMTNQVGLEQQLLKDAGGVQPEPVSGER